MYIQVTLVRLIRSSVINVLCNIFILYMKQGIKCILFDMLQIKAAA